MLAIRDREERQPGRTTERVGRDEAYFESLPDGHDMLLSVRKRKDIIGNGDAYGPAVVDFGR